MRKSLGLLLLILVVSGCSRGSSTGAAQTAPDASPGTLPIGIAPSAQPGMPVGCSAGTCKTIAQIAMDAGSVAVLEREADDSGATCDDEEVRLGASLLVRSCVTHEHPLTVKQTAGDLVEVVRDGQSVPSNWVGIERATFATTSGARLTALSTVYWNRMDACAREEAAWSFETMSGNVQWSASCASKEPCTKHRYVSIPRLAAGDGAEASTLGSCATKVDAAHAIVSGKPTVSFGASLVGDVLLVEISDDKLVTRGTLVDHLEVWTASEADGYMTHCAGGDLPVPRKVIVPLDGLSPAHTLRLELPAGTNGLAVAYVDTDDGEHVAGTLATGEALGTPGSLGRPFDVKDYGACSRPEGGRLAVWKPRPTSEKDPLWNP